MTTAPPRDPNDALAALERLHTKGVVTLEEAQAAARLITGDPDAPFPPRRGARDAPAEGADGSSANGA